jgi:hypothetical protein
VQQNQYLLYAPPVSEGHLGKRLTTDKLMDFLKMLKTSTVF